jgi:hypothetical protein
MLPSSMIPGIINSGYEDRKDRESKQSMVFSIAGIKLCVCI